MQLELGQRFRLALGDSWGRIETHSMSQAATFLRSFVVVALTAAATWAQAAPQLGQQLGQQQANEALSWRRLGRPSINSHLAGPETGPVSAVWYSLDGGTLFAKTQSGRVFQTADFETWSSSDATRPEISQAVSAARKPEAQANVIAAAGDTRRYWSLGRSLFSSDDGGVSWTNLSGPGDGVIGAGQHDVAVKPDGSSAFAVANDAGVWQSQDGGQSWSGLNENLPNFPIARIVSTARGAVQVALEDGRVLRLGDVRAPWELTSASAPAVSQARDQQRSRSVLGGDITAIERAGDLVYAGSSDGRLWVSRDRGANWALTQVAAHGAVERIYMDADAPRAAIAVVAGSHLLRTVNAGAVWDDITGNLSDAGIHGVTADRAAGVAYAATDRGIYMAHVDMNAFTPASPWMAIGGSLPFARAVDVALDGAGRQLFAALDGYGLYTAPAPARRGGLRLTNAADFSTRPAAPGSLISVIGGKVTAARAGDLNFPILASGNAESQLQVPFEASNNVDLAIDAAHGSVILPLTIRSVSPAIFVDPDGSPFLVDADSGLALAADSPAYPRARLQLMATGLGRVQPDWRTGTPAPLDNPPAVVASVKAYLDGIPVEVTKATLAPGYVGYYLVEVQLPALLNSGPAEFYITADGLDSNKVRLTVDAQSVSPAE